MVAPKGDHSEVMSAMLQDRDLVRDRLLLGLVAVQLHAESGRVGWKDAARAAVGKHPGFLAMSTMTEGGFPVREPGGHLGWLRAVIATDLPRYMPPRLPLEGRGSGCIARTPRKETCGRPVGAGLRFYEADPDTGEMRMRRFCHRHRAEAFTLQEEIAARPPAPRPAANRGGVLARHIDTDWKRLYRWVDEEWTMPPSGPPQPRPKLTVLVTDEVDYTPPSEARKVTLTLAART